MKKPGLWLLVFTLFSVPLYIQAQSFSAIRVITPTVRPGDIVVVKVEGDFAWSVPLKLFDETRRPNNRGFVYFGVDALNVRPKQPERFNVFPELTEDQWVQLKSPIMATALEVIPHTIPIRPFGKRPPPLKPEEQKRVAQEQGQLNAAFETSKWDYDITEGEAYANPLEAMMVTSPYSIRRYTDGYQRLHKGVDLRAAVGTKVFSVNTGTVILAEPDFLLEGGFVVIDHGSGIFSYYMHLSELNVAQGQGVFRGQVIGKTGDTGKGIKGSPHLHWGVKVGKVSVNPLWLLEGRKDVEFQKLTSTR